MCQSVTQFQATEKTREPLLSTSAVGESRTDSPARWLRLGRRANPWKAQVRFTKLRANWTLKESLLIHTIESDKLHNFKVRASDTAHFLDKKPQGLKIRGPPTEGGGAESQHWLWVC